MNKDRTSPNSDTSLTQADSRPVRFELVSYRGEIFGPYSSTAEAREAAKMKWPDQEQGEDRTGEGWDIQVAGAK